MAWRVRVGLEVHARVSAASKLFSGARATFVGGSANTQVARFDRGLPGTLPRVNAECVAQAVRTGLALGGEVRPVSLFERKHYFYGDSPLGYQVTQQRWPIVVGGQLDFKYVEDKGRAKTAKKTKKNKKGGKGKKGAAAHGDDGDDDGGGGSQGGQHGLLSGSVRITRIQLEQDTGRTLEGGPEGTNLVDLNRAGAGVMEIVTEPDMHSAREAGAFCSSIRALLETIGTCDGNMQDGSLRFDVNVTVHNDADKIDSHRVEVKNLNSIRSVERAVEHEQSRLVELYATEQPGTRGSGHETRSFNAQTGESDLMRRKEDTADYRFFPEPDLPPLRLGAERIAHLERTMPELPQAILARLMAAPLSLPEDVAHVIFGESGGVSYFMAASQALRPDSAATSLAVATFIVNVQLGLVRRQQLGLGESVRPAFIARLVELEAGGIVSAGTSKRVLGQALDAIAAGEVPPEDPAAIVEARGWAQINDEAALEAVCERVLEAMQATGRGKANLAAYYGGKAALLDFFLGAAMRETHGRANPHLLQRAMQGALARRAPAL